MALPLYDVNYLAIIICLVVHMALGFLWYSKVLFQESWIKLAKISDAQMRQGSDNMSKTMLIATVSGFILIFMLAQSVKSPEINTALESLEMAFWLWLGFIATVMTGTVLFEGKPWKLYLINSSYYLVSMAISSLVFYFWN
jgi:hypothetical protein